MTKLKHKTTYKYTTHNKPTKHFESNWQKPKFTCLYYNIYIYIIYIIYICIYIYV